MTTDSFEYKAGSMSSVVNGRPGVLNLDEAQGIVECFVSGIGNKDSVGDIVHSGAFTKSLMRRKPRVVWGHNWNDPIGKVLEIYEVPSTDPRLPLKMKMAGIGGLFARVQFNLGSEKGREAFANVAFFGEEQEWSIGYKTLRAQFDQKSQANMIYELELYEVSPVLHGANQLTGTISVKGGMPDSAVMEQMPMPMGQPQAPSMMTMIEKELQKLMRNRVSVTEVDEEDGMISFEKEEENGETDSYKCRFSRGDHGSYMFGAPERIVVIAKPTMHSPSMPGGAMPSVDPQRVVRPSQMPAIPIAIKPGPNGMMAVPLPVMRYEGQEQKPINENDLDQEESDLRDALLKIVKRHGKLNEDSDGIWAAYTPAARNHVAGIGVKCSNCVFYQKDNTCKIVDMPIEPEGKCRFAVIPNGVVKGDFASKKQYEFETEDNEDEYVSDFEFKYPGELFVAALRGSVGRKRKKKRKFKHLAEFGTYEDQLEMGKPYYLPVLTDQIFHVKQALDPIFEYHKVETYVDPEGIVITDGASYELIDAIDMALDNLKKKDLIPEGLSVKASAYRLGRAIGNRIDNRPGIGGARSARRFFSTPNAQSFDPRTAIDRNLNGVVGEGIFLRGVSLEQPDPTPNGPGSINNPKVPDVKPNIDAIDAPGTEAIPDPKLNTEKITPSRRVVEKKPTVQPKVGKVNPVSSAMKNAQAKNKEYLKYLTKKNNEKTLEERIKFDGAYSAITKSGRFSSGENKDDPNALKPGDIVDTGTEDGRAILQAYYDKMQEEIIKMLESAVNNPEDFKWELPWREGEHSPRNPTRRNQAQRGRNYQGSNRSMLNSIAVNRGYETNKWAGISQWRKLGGKASKNARPVPVLVPIAGSEPRKYKVEEVYNVADIVGLKPAMYEAEIDLENMTAKQRAKNAEEIVKEVGPRIRENQVGGAFFSPAQDFINMPFFDSFETAEGYYATLLHEITHWTGHPSRNDRDQVAKHGSQKYAYEELIAEIGSAMLLGFVGISPEVRKDHIGYLAGWLSVIKTDKTALKRAFGEAQQAVDYLLNKSKTLRSLAGMEDNERKSKKSVRDSVPISMLEGFEDAPNVPTTQPISGPFEDIDLINISDDREFSFFGEVPFYDKEKDLTDTSDLPSSAYVERYGAPTKEERRLSDFPSVFSSGGNPLTISGKFSSGNERIKAKEGSGIADVLPIRDDINIKEIFGLSIPPTDEQRAILSLALKQFYGKQPFVQAVNAAAGSGKTTTTKMIAAAIGNEFETEFLFDRFTDQKNLGELLFDKLSDLTLRYMDTTDEYKEFSDRVTATLFAPGKITKKRNKQIAELITELKDIVNRSRPENIQNKSNNLYYMLFGKEAKTEALDAFPRSTGVATSTQISFWGLKLGDANSEGTLLPNPDQWPVKMEYAADMNVLGRRTGTTQTLGYDRSTRKHKAATITTQGSPTLAELGYFSLENTADVRRFLTEMEQHKDSSDVGKQIKKFPEFKLTRITIPATRTRRAKELNENIIMLPGLELRGGLSFLTDDEYAEIILAAVNRFARSANTEITEEIFDFTHFEQDKSLEGTRQRKKNLGLTSLVDDEDTILAIKNQSPEEFKRMFQIAQYIISEQMDGNGSVMPNQTTYPKLLLMANVRLDKMRGLVGHGDRNSKQNIKHPGLAKVEVGDIVYVGDNGLHYEEINGQPSRKWTKDDPGEAYLVTRVKQATMDMKKVYASEENPLGLMILDEAQDLNDVWAEIIKRNREALSTIAVGDERQAIMGFNGSKNIMAAIEPTFQPKLTQSYRFGSTAGYLSTVILAKQNLENERFPENDRVVKFVEGVADTAAINNLDSMFRLLEDGKYVDAFAIAEFLDKKYGLSLMGEIESIPTKKPAGQKIAITNLRNKLPSLRAQLKEMLDTKIVTINEESLRGNLPTMILSRGKGATMTEALEHYVEPLKDMLVFYGGSPIDRKLLSDPNLSQKDFIENRNPINVSTTPTITITPNAYQEAVDFFMHLAYIDFPTTRRKPKAVTGLGEVWTKKGVEAQLLRGRNQALSSLYNFMRRQAVIDPRTGNTRSMYPTEMLELFKGRIATNPATGEKKFIAPLFSPLRDAIEATKMNFTLDPDPNDPTRVAGRSLNELLGQLGTNQSIGAVSKIDVLSKSPDGTRDRAYFELELDFADENSFNEDDFFVITENPLQGVPDTKSRVRIVSKWDKDGNSLSNSDSEGKFEVIAEAEESDLEEGEERTKALARIAFTKMRNLMVRSSSKAATSRQINPAEQRYAQAASNFRWTGRLILTGQGIDSPRPTVKADGKHKVVDRPIYVRDAQRVLQDLKIKGQVAYGVGVLRGGAQRRAFDGFIFDVKGNEELALEIINNVGDGIRKSASYRSPDITVQTATTAKGAESKFVYLANDFSPAAISPDQALLENVYQDVSPVWMEENNLQMVAASRTQQYVAMSPEFFDIHYAPSDDLDRANEHIKKQVEAGVMPATLLDSMKQLEPENLPPFYAAYSKWVKDGRNPADEPDEKNFSPLLMEDDKLREFAEVKKLPKAIVEDFIKRRQKKKEEMEEEAGPDAVGRFDNSSVVRKMRMEAEALLLSGFDFSEPTEYKEDEEDEESKELQIDENSILDDIDDIENEKDRDNFDVDLDDPDNAGNASGTFSSGASDETVQPKTRRVKGRPDVSRFGRRLRRYEDNKGIRRQLSALDLSGSRWDVSQNFDVLDHVMKFWDGFSKTGIALDMPVDAKLSIAERRKRIPLAIEAVGKKMRESGVVRVGNLRENRATDDHSSDTWMLSVDTLRDALRIPTDWTVQKDVSRGNVVIGEDGEEKIDAPMSTNWSKSKPMSFENLAKLLGLRKGPQLSELEKSGAALSFNTVKYLIAEIGKSPDFDSWRLFSPVSNKEAKELGLAGLERFAENIGRAGMRERFIIETFGEDAYPFWYNKLKKPDPEENFDDVFQLSQTELPETAGEMITPAQYADLYENSPVSRFIAEGKFQNAPNSRDDSEVELLLSLSPLDDEGSEEMEELKIYLNAPSAKGEKTRRTDFPLAPLLEQLGIEDNAEWSSQLKRVLQNDASFGRSEAQDIPDVGLGPDAARSWEKDGVPTAYIAEMIRTGLIENASSVWRTNNSGERLDQELIANKPAVYEALTQFIDKSFPDSLLNNAASRQQIVNNRDMPLVLENAAKNRGRNFSKKLGDIPRYSVNGLQEMVDEFNKIFGTNHTIDDLFSAEQLRNAQRVLNEGTTTYGKNKPRKGTRKVTSNTVNAE